MPQLSDCAHWFGGDLQISPTGDLSVVATRDRSQQRVLRRLCTNPRGYLFHLLYGAGVPQQVGAISDPTKVQALIRGQMKRDITVSSTDPIAVSVTVTTDGLSAEVAYLTAPDKQPVSLAFDASP